MARKPGFHVGLVLMLLFLISACSGGGDPITGSTPGGDEGLTGHRTVNVSNPRVLWGYYNCVIDLESGTVEAVPARGLMMHVNAVEWMQPPAGSLENLGIRIVDDSKYMSEGRIDLDVSLTHPLAGLDQYTGFDVMGVFITDGHRNLLSQPGVRYSDGGAADATMLNLDGYTRWWNQDEFDDPRISIFSHITGRLAVNPEGLDATINPYKYFTEGLGATDDVTEFIAANPDARGVFPAATTLTRRYELVWPFSGPLPRLAFDYAVVASWEPPTDTPPTVPDDFPITANALEPIALSVTDNSDLYYDDVNDISGGAVNLELEVYGWQGLVEGQTLEETIDRIVIEFQTSDVFPTGATYSEDSSTWNVSGGAVHSSVWQIDIPGLEPKAIGDTPVVVILETVYDYDNGFGTGYPLGAPLSSYFMTSIEVFGAAGIPTCEEPVAEFEERTYVEVEEFTTSVSAPGGTDYHIDWSVNLLGNPKNWVNTDTEEILVNWYSATNMGSALGDYEVCVSVYSDEGFNECCLSPVTVSDVPELTPVTGQNDITPPQQPDQGSQPCDIALWNSGSGSIGEIVYQDVGMGEVRIYRFNDNYTTIIGTSALDNSGAPPPLDDATQFNDYHKFDVRPNGQHMFISSSSAVWPSLVDPGGYNINDPFHAWILPYFNLSGQMIIMGLYGDIGQSGNPDPDNVPWKHVVDWTEGPVNYQTRMYGLQTISELWVGYSGQQHPGSIYAIYSKAPYASLNNDFDAIGLGGLSTQNPSGGDVDDTAPNLMALAVDDDCWVQADWSSDPGELLSDIVVWYMLSSESTAADRKVHFILLPEDIDNGFDIFYYDDFIGNGSGWGVDFGGDVPVDIEVIYSSDPDNGFDNKYDWLCVLLETGTGWTVNAYRYDPMFGSVALIDSYNDPAIVGTPTALDVDQDDLEIHVLYDDAGTYKVTVLEFTP